MSAMSKVDLEIHNENYEVVDHAIAHSSYAGTRVMAQTYRAQYPRVEKEEGK